MDRPSARAGQHVREDRLILESSPLASRVSSCGCHALAIDCPGPRRAGCPV